MPSKITLGRIELQSRIMNSSGPWADDKEKLLLLCGGKIGAVVTKTFTLKPSSGNDEPNKYFAKNFSINSVGLKNKGSDYFIRILKELPSSKPIIASIAESSPDRIEKLAIKVTEAGFDAIELNLSCPNLKGKEPIAYYPKELDALLSRVLSSTDLPIGIKIPPFVTRTQFEETSNIIRKHKINHLVLINTYPFAYMSVSGDPVIKPNSGVGGLGGSYLKPIALAHTIMFKEYLPDVSIVAVGGIVDSQDVEDYLQAGASAVQVGSAINNYGLNVLEELALKF